MLTPPSYRVESVDHALRLALVLQQEGPLRVFEAADRIGVARSTAHRLLSMLVFRGFAVKDENRRYHAGDVLRRGFTPMSSGSLRRHAIPCMRELVEKLQETVTLAVRDDDRIRFAATVECGQLLRVGDREGYTFPAYATSAGKVILAGIPITTLQAVLSAPSARAVDLAALTRELHRIRRQRFAVNDQRTEPGVTSISYPVCVDGETLAALSIAMPSVRYDRSRLPMWVATLNAAVDDVQKALDATPAQTASSDAAV